MVFASIFQDTENFHLVKEDGMIAYIMQEVYGYKSYNVLSESRDYPYKKGFYKKIRTPMIKESKNAGEVSKKIRRTLWIIKNAKKIDVLNLWFANRWTYFNIFFYGILNRKGLVYVHCDSSGKILKRIESKNLFVVAIKHIMLTDQILNRVLWGVQGIRCSRLLKRWPFKNVAYIPNGFWWENDQIIDYQKKENVILFVGRIGAPEKKNQTLLEAFCKVSKEFPNWKLKMTGSIDKSFLSYLDEYFRIHSELRDRVVFTGTIEDRELLREEYAKAKMFVLTSIHESFGIVLVEAQSQGCFIISTDLEASKDIIGSGGNLGELFAIGDVDALAEIILRNIRDESVMKTQCPIAQSFANKNFRYDNALRPLHEWIQQNK